MCHREGSVTLQRLTLLLPMWYFWRLRDTTEHVKGHIEREDTTMRGIEAAATILFAISLTLTPAPANGGAVIYVDDDAPNDPGPGDPLVSDPEEDGSVDHPYDAIQEGIDAAVGGDEVVVSEGTYTGRNNVDLRFYGKAITLRSESGPENTIIDGQEYERGFYFVYATGPYSIVDGFTIANGRAGPGAGVYCKNADPTIINCTIRNCWADEESGDLGGGGMYCENSSPTITDCRFISNWANRTGAGLHIRGGNPTITNCSFIGNVADEGGGGMYLENGSATVEDSIFIDNHAWYSSNGGGVYLGNGNWVFRNCEIRDNIAEGGGGGIYQVGGDGSRLINCAIIGNQAEGTYDGGGGIRIEQCRRPLIAGCLISGNVTSYHGGGLYCYSTSGAEPIIANCTFSQNTAGGMSGKGGGVYCEGLVHPFVANCVFWDDFAMDGPEIALYSSVSHTSHFRISYSDIEGGEDAIHVSGNLILWRDGNIDDDPMFVDPDGADGDPATWEDNDLHLSPGSPCIDAGDDWFVPADVADLDGDGDTDEPLPFDLDGNPRFVGPVDMGAYETTAPIQEPVITGWRSVKLHDGAGDCAVQLDTAGVGSGAESPTIDSRSDVIERLLIDFDQPVQLVPGALIEATDSTSGAVHPASSLNLIDEATTLEAYFDPATLQDKSCYIVDLAGAVQGLQGQPIDGDTDCMVCILVCDVGGDGIVDNSDMIGVRVRRGQAVTADNCRYDINHDGSIDNSDLIAVRVRRGNAITGP